MGIVASVTAPFCGACDGVRLTADGMVRNCLFARGEVDLRGPLRDGADDQELVRLIRGETVSYTHLDVYKRQLQHPPPHGLGA